MSPKILKELKISEKDSKGLDIYQGKGCKECSKTGFLGRTSIFEILVLNDEINEMILSGASAIEIKKKAIANGMKTLSAAGWEKVEKGITTPEEVIRVTQERSKRKA